MRKCARNEIPAFLQANAEEFQRKLAVRLRESPPRKFYWPSRGGIKLQDVVLKALIEMTQRRCAYCDADAIDATGVEEIDHFRPKVTFPESAYEWSNLYLSCSACNRSKQERWHDDLLAPDSSGFDFERFFFYEATTGRILPNPGATELDQQRARVTIDIFGFNRPGACSRRIWTVRLIQSMNSPELLEMLGYRYLVPLIVSKS